jgi:hypothetical protein
MKGKLARTFDSGQFSVVELPEIETVSHTK